MHPTGDSGECRRLAEALLPVALAAGRVQLAHVDLYRVEDVEQFLAQLEEAR